MRRLTNLLTIALATISAVVATGSIAGYAKQNRANRNNQEQPETNANKRKQAKSQKNTNQ